MKKSITMQTVPTPSSPFLRYHHRSNEQILNNANLKLKYLSFIGSNLIVASSAISTFRYLGKIAITIEQYIKKYPDLVEFIIAPSNKSASKKTFLTGVIHKLYQYYFTASATYFTLVMLSGVTSIAMYGLWLKYYRKHTTNCIHYLLCILMCFPPVILISLFTVHSLALLHMSTRKFGNSAKDHIVVMITGIIIAVLVARTFIQKIKENKLTVLMSLPFILSISGFLILSCVAICTYNSYFEGSGQLAIGFIGFMTVIIMSLLIYQQYKKAMLQEKTAAISATITIFFSSIFCVCCFTMHELWNSVGKKLDIIIKYMPFIYCIAISNIIIYRVSRFSKALTFLMQKHKNQSPIGKKYFFFNVIACALNIMLDFSFLVLCVSPAAYMKYVEISMPPKNIKSILAHFNEFKRSLNLLIELSSSKHQLFIVSFTLIIMSRLVISVITTALMIKKRKHHGSVLKKWHDVCTTTHTAPNNVALSLGMIGVLFLVADGCIFHFNQNRVLSNIYLSISIIFMVTAILFAVFKKVNFNSHKAITYNKQTEITPDCSFVA